MTALKVGFLKVAYYSLALLKLLTVFYYIGFENGTFTGLEFIINTIITFIILIVL